MADQDATPAPGTSDAAPAAAAPADAAPAAAPAAATNTPPADAAPASADASAAAPSAAAPSAATEPPPAGKDWATRRTEYAKGDEKLEKRLARYSSENDVIDALLAAQNKISSGGVKAALPANATPEQVAEWRADNGIPESPEGYDLTLPDGRIVGEADKPFVDEYLKTAHAKNMSPEQVQSTVSWYLAEQERLLNVRHEQDTAILVAAEDTLRAEWGSEYRLNNNLINGMLDTAPAGVKEQLLGARLGDGTPFGSDPATLRWLATVARTLNPTATVVPGSGTNAMQTIETELGNIQKLMGDRKSEYWKGPNAEKMQARYRELITVKEKLK